MRVAWRAGNKRLSVLLRRMGRRARRVTTGTGMLALAVPLAWPAGAGGQHLDIPSAGSVRSGIVRLADFVSGQSNPAPTVPAQQAGTAPAHPGQVPASVTRAVARAQGSAPFSVPGDIVGIADVTQSDGSQVSEGYELVPTKGPRSLTRTHRVRTGHRSGRGCFLAREWLVKSQVDQSAKADDRARQASEIYARSEDKDPDRAVGLATVEFLTSQNNPILPSSFLMPEVVFSLAYRSTIV